MSYNNIEGTIPISFTSFTRNLSADVSGNELRGPVPVGLEENQICDEAEYFDGTRCSRWPTSMPSPSLRGSVSWIS